jgi:ubiquinone/menaquinone biosynthesis C-methylase UbiE
MKDWSEVHRDQHFVSWIQGIPAGASVLEVGAGLYPKREEVESQHAHYVGIDLCALPMQDDGVYVFSDAHHLPFADNSFDRVFALATLEHVAQPWSVLRECARVLKLGGTLLWHACFWEKKHADPMDYWRFTDDCARYLTQEMAGLQILKITSQVDPHEPDGDPDIAPSYWSIEAWKEGLAVS